MIRDGTSRLRQRLLVGLLAAWMAAFAVASSVHNHGLPGPMALRATQQQSEAGESRGDTCLACLVSHIPIPVPESEIPLPAPIEAQGILSTERALPVLVASFLPRPSRAPPTSCDVAA